MRASRLSPIPLIAFVVFFVIFLGLSIFAYQKGEEAKKVYASSEKKLSDIENSIKLKEERLKRISNLVGFHQPMEDGGNLRTGVQPLIDKLDLICSDENVYGTKKFFGIEKLENQAIDAEQLRTAGSKYAEGLIKLQNVWDEYSARIIALQDEISNNPNGNLEKKLQEKQQEYETLLKERKDQIAKLQSEVLGLRENVNTFRVDKERELADEEKLRLESQLAKNEEKERVAILRKQQKEQEEKYKQELENLNQRITELNAEAAGVTGIERLYADKTRKNSQDGPDGEIIHVNEALKIAYIDLGRPDGVLPGLKFDVFRYEKGGVKRIKGKIEIKQVKQTMSMVGIVTVKDDLDPITRGDKIINPVYDRNKTTYFVVAGNLSAKYSKQQAARKVESLGGKIEDEISAKTDFVVLAGNFENDPIYKRSVELGIETMLESEFVNYLDNYNN